MRSSQVPSPPPDVARIIALPVEQRDPARPYRQGRGLAIAGLTAICFLGVVAGIALDQFVLRPTVATHFNYGRVNFSLRPPSQPERRAMRDALARDLRMTPQQRAQIDSIMDRRARDFQALRDALRPRVDQLVTDVRQEIDQILTPEQRERFRRLQQEARKSE